MANTIALKYSTTTPAPLSLSKGEVAWAKVTRRLYIGEDDGSITVVAMPISPEDIEAIAAQVNVMSTANQLETFHEHFTVLNGSQPAIETLLSPELTSTALTAWIADTANQTQFRILLHIPIFVSALIDWPERLALFAANTITASLLINSPDAFGLLSKNQSAMQVLWAQNMTADLIWNNPLARLAVWQSDMALAALQATPTQIQRKIDAGAVSVAATSANSFTFVPIGRKTLLLRRYFTGNTSAAEWLTWGREGLGDALLPNGTFLNTGTSAAKGRTTNYTNSGTFPNASNANANCVCATNGLARGGSTVTATPNIIYVAI